MSWLLISADGASVKSGVPGTLGGHRRSRIYGALTCRTAVGALRRGGYAEHRVFFADDSVAVAAGYRPCAVCLPDRYAAWRATSG